MIPKNIDSVYQELKSEVVSLHARWKVFRQLFAGSARRIDLLNACARTFFYLVQETLWADVQISLSKLTDPTRGTLSLQHLQKRLAGEGDAQLAKKLGDILDALLTACEPFHRWRNKRLAHLDLATALNQQAHTLAGVSREMIEQALHLVREYMNGIERHYHDAEIGYEHFIMAGHDGDALVHILSEGLRYEHLVGAGTIPLDDRHASEWRDV